MYDIDHFYQALSVEDAIRALKEDGDAVLIAGGTDVLIKIREGRLTGCRLVSIHGLPELSGIRMEEDRSIVIGSGTVFSDIASDPLIARHLPILAQAADQVGSPQIRNMGTLGGNLCNGVTSADSASALLTLNAALEFLGPDGLSQIPLEQFYEGPGRTRRRHDQVLTSVRIGPGDYEGFSGKYIKYGKREAMEIATLGCAVSVKLTEDKKYIGDLRIAYGVAAPVPVRCRRTEEKAAGMRTGKELLETAGRSVLEEITPRSSFRASEEFRTGLAEELVKRALRQAVIDAGGEADA